MDRCDSPRAFAYLDGPDARLFKALKSKLGSDERVQAALILTGLLYKLESSANRKKIERIKKSFNYIVGMPYQNFEEFVDSIL